MPVHAVIRAIECHLPEHVLTTADLAQQFPEWAVEKIEASTGIRGRHIAAPQECASDLAEIAARKLFDSGVCPPERIDYVLLCTQTPDYFLPPTACVLQHRLGIPTSAGAFDFNLGSSGYVYGLGLAEALIATHQASTVLLLTADTYSKLVHPEDRSVRTIFGDAATATLLVAEEHPEPPLGPFVYGTDGAGANNLIVPAGGFRQPPSPETKQVTQDEQGNFRSSENLFMAGAEIFHFTLTAVPPAIDAVLAKAAIPIEDVDLFVFHQPNRYMLEYMRKRMKLDPKKFFIHLEDCGNTVSCTIPIALEEANKQGLLKPGALVLLAGFGVGYSWATTLLRWV